jgi:hypothetical protein
MLCTIQFPAAWVTTIKLDEVLAQSGGPHSPQFSSVTFKFPSGCKIMIDAVVRILSVANQLMFSNKQVRLVFNEKPNGIMGYLDRMGFFDYLDEAVEVLPYRPKDSTADAFRGKNIDLVEIAGIDRNNRDRNIVPRMADTLSRRIPDSSKNESFGNAFYIVLGELIGNIYRHCEIDLNGFAALQTCQSALKIDPP